MSLSLGSRKEGKEMNAKEALAVAKQVRESQVASVFLVAMGEIRQRAKQGLTCASVKVPSGSFMEICEVLRGKGYQVSACGLDTESHRLDIDWSGA
jgi:hypothetical protein